MNDLKLVAPLLSKYQCVPLLRDLDTYWEIKLIGNPQALNVQAREHDLCSYCTTCFRRVQRCQQCRKKGYEKSGHLCMDVCNGCPSSSKQHFGPHCVICQHEVCGCSASEAVHIGGVACKFGLVKTELAAMGVLAQVGNRTMKE